MVYVAAAAALDDPGYTPFCIISTENSAWHLGVIQQIRKGERGEVREEEGKGGKMRYLCDLSNFSPKWCQFPHLESDGGLLPILESIIL